MINPFYHSGEKRFRSGIRILFFFITLILIIGGLQSVELGGWQWFLVIPISYAWYRLNLFLTDQRIAKSSPWYDGGFEPTKVFFQEYALGWLIGILSLSLVVGMSLLLGWYRVAEEASLISSNAEGGLWEEGSQWYSLLLLFIQMLAVGFYEELLTRGYFIINLQEGLRFGLQNSIGPLLAAIILSSGLFSIAHIFNPNASFWSSFNIFIAGVLLATPFILTGRLGLSMGLHSAWNFVLAGLYGLPVSGLGWDVAVWKLEPIGPKWWTGGIFGPEAGFFGFIGIGLSFILIFIFLQIRTGQIGIHPNWLNSAKESEHK